MDEMVTWAMQLGFIYLRFLPTSSSYTKNPGENGIIQKCLVNR